MKYALTNGKILDGNLDEVIDALATREQAEKLQKLDL